MKVTATVKLEGPFTGTQRMEVEISDAALTLTKKHSSQVVRDHALELTLLDRLSIMFPNSNSITISNTAFVHPQLV
jgi:hypothetical protein